MTTIAKTAPIEPRAGSGLPGFSTTVSSRPPLNHYGSLEDAIRGLRALRPLDLSAPRWRSANPRGTFEEWQREARRCLLEGMHYDPGPLDLRPETLGRSVREKYTQELVAFHTTPWFRVEGCLLLPRGASAAAPAPGLLVFHEWGGPMLFGKERVVDTGRDHPLLAEHRALCSGGRYLAEVFAEAGYATLTIDAFHFGARAPRGLNGLPESYDPMGMTAWELLGLELELRKQIPLALTQLQFAGATWTGVNYWDDSRCLDYLLTRPEIDGSRLGCTGLSGGGWRTNVLAAGDPRIKASVSVGWMTTADHQQVYNLAGAIGVFALLPGVWGRMDIPDLTLLAAPGAAMVASLSEDTLFPPEGQAEADRQAREGFAWAGCPNRYHYFNPPKGHCYDAEVQAEAIRWLDRALK